MIKFEIAKGYEDKEINLPKRGTEGSAGYDIEAAEDMIIPSLFHKLKDVSPKLTHELTLDIIKDFVKKHNLRVMVPTGLKAKMPEGMVLKIYPRSSIGANCLLQLANQTGIIDRDYYGNPDNDGAIFIPLINLTPYNIKIRKGDKIAQGIFEKYFITDDDESISKTRYGGFGSTDKSQ